MLSTLRILYAKFSRIHSKERKKRKMEKENPKEQKEKA